MLAVLNPGGRDPDQVFASGAGTPDAAVPHPPVNYHAYAACCGGGFFRSVASIPATTKLVLVLLRERNLAEALAAVRRLRETTGAALYVSLKESGSHQVAQMLGDARRHAMFRAICGEVEGAISSTPGLVALYRTAGAREVHFVPTPYPVDVSAWDFSRPTEERSGIFVGTREFRVPSRNHLVAVALADEISRDLACPITVLSCEGRSEHRLLEQLSAGNPHVRILRERLPYADYLRLMAAHRLVWQLDASHVPGQVAGDALLCRMPCVGGNGAIDRLAFGGGDSTPDTAVRHARALLQDDNEWRVTVELSQTRARALLAFDVVAAQLRTLAAA